ncbi:MAG: FG-GAP repeat protein [Planctomycetota bacterium]
MTFPSLRGAAAALMLGSFSAVAAQQQLAKFVPTEVAPGDGFGGSVAVQVPYLVMGAPFANAGPNQDAGAVFVFEQGVFDLWFLDDILTASNGQPFDHLGESVAIDGSILVAGAPDTATGGAVYIYTLSGGSWTEIQVLEPTDHPQASDNFGESVAVSGGRLIGGDPGDDETASAAGAAYVFAQGIFGIWFEEAKLLASDGTSFDDFGASVAISGDQALVGAPSVTDAFFNQGAAYRYTRTDATGWTESQRLVASDPNGVAEFGASVALSGTNRAIIGAPGDDEAGPSAGAAYIFEPGVFIFSWVQVSKLMAADGGAGDNFGTSVGIDGDRAVVGSPEWDAPGGFGSGSAYLFERVGSSWSPTCHLLRADPANFDGIGGAVAVEGDLALVAGRFAGPGGETYLFDADPAPDFYGCSDNPAGSLVEVSGAPEVGGTWTLGVDNPLGTQAPGSIAYVRITEGADPNYPCGTPIPGWGMGGPGTTGSILVDISGPEILSGPSIWDGMNPAPVDFVFPSATFGGRTFFFQGILIDPSFSPVPLGLTQAVVACIAP